VVSLLAEGLVARGVDVTLFATGNSETESKLHSISPVPHKENKNLDVNVCETLHAGAVFEQVADFDLIHNHCDFLPLTYSGLVDTPMLTTIHQRPSPEILPVYRHYNKKTRYVSTSNTDRSPELDYIATVYDGIDIENFKLNENTGDYLLFFGRIHPDSGALEAIEISRMTGMKLVLAGIIQDEKYFETEIAPRLDGNTVKYTGSVEPALRNTLLGRAHALLHPVLFGEPLDLSLVESNACGTPVIAFNHGSVSEIIQDGVNGFIVSDVSQVGEAVRRISTLSRKMCRDVVEERFSKTRMVEDYLKVYAQVLDETKREDHRPWGHYEVLSDLREHKVKRIVVYPGKKLSLQRHRHRCEHWTIVNGAALVTLDSQEIFLKAGESVDIPVGTIHRVFNPGEESLVFIEVQTGEYFGEDDIERLEDDFGRA
jgi:mannose-6-phosphate isomerase-like protein (cupin superfamily)